MPRRIRQRRLSWEAATADGPGRNRCGPQTPHRVGIPVVPRKGEPESAVCTLTTGATAATIAVEAEHPGNR
jgi:hypothetical protein